MQSDFVVVLIKLDSLQQAITERNDSHNINCIYKLVQNKETDFLFRRFNFFLNGLCYGNIYLMKNRIHPTKYIFSILESLTSFVRIKSNKSNDEVQ